MNIMRKVLFFLFAVSALYVNSQDQAICGGTSGTIVPTSTLTNPSYTLNPGNFQPANGVFVVSPTVTTTYTIVASGSVGTTFTTQSTLVTVTVNPQPNSVPTVTNMTCTADTAAYNLNLTFNPGNPAPNYTITWGGSPPSIPNGWTTGQTSGSGTLAPGAYTANIEAEGGCTLSVTFTIMPQPAPTVFTLVPLGPTYSVTCKDPTLNINASNAAYTYTFYSNTSTPITASAVAVTYTDSGNWSVTGVNPTTGCARTQTFSVMTNTVLPGRNATPAFQVVDCTNPVAQTVILTATPQVNITHSVVSNVVPVFIAQNATVNYSPGPDTYTHYVINNANGCVSVGQFTVSASVGVPTFSVSSPQNFTLGCNSKSFAVITFSGSTTPTEGGVVSYTLLSPSASSVLPGGNLSSTNVYTVTAPGTWTGVARDNVQQCDTRFAFSVTQNTFQPVVDSIVIPKPVLDCNVPQVILKGHSSTPGAAYQWGFPAGTLAGNSVTVDANFTQRQSTLVANYSLTVTNPHNACITVTVVPMKQNLFPPVARIGSTNSLTCKTSTVEITNQSFTGIPPSSGYPTNSLVIGFLWQGPSPQIPKSNASSYIAFQLGQYTLTAQDLNNGCTSVTTAAVGEDRVYPLLNEFKPVPPIVISCSAAINAPVTEVTVAISTPTTDLTYSWTAPPNATLATGSQFSRIAKTNSPGKYYIQVSDISNGCVSFDSVTVINGTLAGSIEANRTQGFAPLTIELFNNSSYNVSGGSTANASITTIWSFGNGLTQVTQSAQVSPTVVYNHAGTYTVVAYIFRGNCADTAYQVINVDFASSMKVPNIFTPNGDGVNDEIQLKAVNLVEITMEIYNRWGTPIYSLTSDKGNLRWDGSNQFGEPAAEGVYFYVIQSRGSDGIVHEDKGTITLVR
jgi:gliding motility-associated-like protein